MSKLKGFLFDMDGVIVDNHSFHYKSWIEFSKIYNFPLNPEIYSSRFNGKQNKDLMPMIFGDITEEQSLAYSIEKEALYRKLYSIEMKPVDGVIEFLDFLVERKYKIALGTSSIPVNVDFIIDRLSLRKYFPIIVNGDDVSKGKPDPEVYLMCASLLDLDPKDCIVFEDSLSGLESGRRAGCQIVGVATSHDVDFLKPVTEFVIKDFTQAAQYLKL